MNLCKEQLDLERLLCGERAGFSCLPSCLPFKRTIFLCLKAPENAEISRSVYCKCWGPQTSLQMPLLWEVSLWLSPLWSLHWRCSTWNEKIGYLAQREEQNHFKEKLTYFWNKKMVFEDPNWKRFCYLEQCVNRCVTANLCLHSLSGLSGYFLASGDGDLGFWWPQKAQTHIHLHTCEHSLAWCVRSGSQVPAPAPCQCWPLCVHREREGAGIGQNWSEVTGKVTVTGSAASSVLQAVLGLFSSRRTTPLCQPCSMDLPKGRSGAYGAGLIFSHRFSLTENTFLKVCISCPFSQDTAIQTCILFLTATGHEGTKYIGFFIVPPSSVPKESGI